jgi:hypothetical protein
MVAHIVSLLLLETIDQRESSTSQTHAFFFAARHVKARRKKEARRRCGPKLKLPVREMRCDAAGTSRTPSVVQHGIVCIILPERDGRGRY